MITRVLPQRSERRYFFWSEHVHEHERRGEGSSDRVLAMDEGADEETEDGDVHHDLSPSSGERAAPAEIASDSRSEW